MEVLNVGATLQSGKFEIVKVLGQGGFGITYLARHKIIGSYFAVKEFFPKGYCGRDSTTSGIYVATAGNVDLVDKLRKRFISEVRNIIALDHPNIVKIHDVFEENGTAYYTMDYIEGTSIQEIVDTVGAFPEKKAIEYIKQVGSALSYIHNRKMTHFDVKPANIMVRDSDKRPILIDFGLSKQYGDQGHALSTLLMGVSKGFSALEQYAQEDMDEFSPQTDVYSLGATLYFMLSGRIPPEAIKLVGTSIEVPVTISSNVSSTIKWAMAPTKEARCPDVDTFLQKLQTGASETYFVGSRSKNNDDLATNQKNDSKNSNTPKIDDTSANSSRNTGHSSNDIGDRRIIDPSLKRKGMGRTIIVVLVVLFAIGAAVYFFRPYGDSDPENDPENVLLQGDFPRESANSEYPEPVTDSASDVSEKPATKDEGTAVKEENKNNINKESVEPSTEKMHKERDREKVSQPLLLDSLEYHEYY